MQEDDEYLEDKKAVLKRIELVKKKHPASVRVGIKSHDGDVGKFFIVQKTIIKLDQLKDQVKSAADEDDIEKLNRFVKILDRTLTGFKFLNAGLSGLHRMCKWFNRSLEPKVYAKKIVELGYNILRTAQQLVRLLDDDSISLSSKLGIMMKAFMGAIFGGIKGMFKAFINKAENKQSGGRFENPIVVGWINFFERWALSYKKQINAATKHPIRTVLNKRQNNEK